MGMAIGDYRNNGLLDLYTGTFSDDYKPLFRDEGKARFTEIATQMGMADVTYPFLTWSTEFIDYDNDGWKDILSVNGHVFPQVDHHNWGTSWSQRPLLFHNLNHGEKFELMPAVEGTGLDRLLARIDAMIEEDRVSRVHLRVPQKEGKVLAMLEAKARIYSRKYKDGAVELEVEAPESVVRRVREWAVG